MMKDNDIKISIIIPVYNIEKYISRMIDSVINQTFSDFELLLVDDGSIDKSGVVCDEYSLKDSRVRVIHQKNQGAHVARNNALKEARGKYVCFFDGDDHVEKNTLFDMYEMAIKYNLQLVITGFYIETYYDVDKYITLDYIPKDNIYLDKDSFRKDSPMYFDINMFYPPWNKLYEKSYLDKYNIEFPKTYRDDFPFVMHVIKEIDRVGFSSKQYYHFFRQRQESETQKFVINLYDKREEEQRLMLETFSYWGLLEDKKSLDMLSRRYIDRLIECMVNLQNQNCTLSKLEKKNEIFKYVNNDYVNICFMHAKPKNLYSKIMYMILKTRNIDLIMFMAKYIHNVKKNNLKMFSILKRNR